MKMDSATETLTAKKKEKKNFGFKFIRIDPDKEHFNIFRAISETFRNN